MLRLEGDSAWKLLDLPPVDGNEETITLETPMINIIRDHKRQQRVVKHNQEIITTEPTVTDTTTHHKEAIRLRTPAEVRGPIIKIHAPIEIITTKMTMTTFLNPVQQRQEIRFTSPIYLMVVYKVC